MRIDTLDYLARQCEAAIAQGRCVDVALSSSLRYDAAHHASNARVTRRTRKAMGDLFDEADHD